MKRAALILALAALCMAQVRMRVNVAGTGGVSTNTISQSDLSYLGFFEVPSGLSTTPNTGDGDFQRLAFFRKGGAVHVLLVQNCCHGSFGLVGPGALLEYTDPGSGYTKDLLTAPHGTLVANWGQTAGGAAYDMWHGKLGTSICLSTTLWSNPGQMGNCTPGTTVNIGERDLGPSNYQIQGLAWHDDGSGHCCAYITYGQGYSNYSPDYNMLVADLAAQGATNVYGPFRTCAGTYGLSGTGGQVCGGFRGFWPWDMPDGSMGISGSSGGYQNSNTGPSIWSGATWPTSGTTQGFGSNRGSADYRTTDVQESIDALSTYSLDGTIAHDGSIVGPNTAFRRTTDATQGNYIYDSDGFDIPQQINPDLYGGVGSFTAIDVIDGGVYINTSPKSALMIGATLVTADTWYRTDAGYTYQANGSGPTLVFQRNAAEAGGCYFNSNANAQLEFDVKPAFYTNVVANAATIEFRNPGTPNVGASVTVSGHNVVVHLATNGVSQSTTTANQVISLIAGNSTANSIFSTSIGTICGTHTSDGTGVVDTISACWKLSGSGCDGGQVSAGVMTPAAGPLYCPVHNRGPGGPVTGPTTLGFPSKQPALIVYSTTKVQAAPISGNPDYSLDPESIIYLRNIDPTMLFNTDDNDPNPVGLDKISGIWFDVTTNRLYVAAPFVDTSTYPGGFSNMPIVHVFNVSTSAPAPSANVAVFALPLLGVLMLVRRRRR